MSWGAPWVLLGLLLPLGLAGGLAVRRRRRDAGLPPTLLRLSLSGRQLRPGDARAARMPWLLLLALALGLVALARPRWGEPRDFAVEQAREVMIALDLSRSMLVDDVAGASRLDRARELLRGLLDRLQGERVGLIVFAGTAYVQVPLSSDYRIIREFLPLLEPGYVPRGGSDYAGMLKAAREGFTPDPETDRYLVVLSDGESTTEGWREQVGDLARRQVRVLAFGLGSEKGGLVPAHGEAEDEPAVISRFQPSTLRALVASTEGVYEHVGPATDLGTVLAATVEQGRKGRYERLLGEARPERFAWFLAPALLCALLGLWREIAVRPRLRRTLQVAGAAVLAVAFAGPVRGHDERGDDKIAFSVSVESTAAQRLLDLVEHLARRGYDAADVRLMVEETINYGIEAQTRHLLLQPGAINDAIAATHEGERVAPQAANWGYLRAQLQKILEPPAAAAGDPKQKPEIEAMDEEDKPPDLGGRSTQQPTADGGGRGGAGQTDASLGDLAKGAARVAKQSTLPPVNLKPQTGQPAYETETGPLNSSRALAIRSWREAIRDDSPGRVHQALQGKAGAKPEGGRDY